MEMPEGLNLEALFAVRRIAWLRRQRVTRIIIDGDKLRQAREATGLTMRALAERIGVSAPYLCDLEKNRRTATDATILKLIDALKEPQE
jgi:predicted transcriptional regulator